MTARPMCPDESILADLLAGRLPAEQAEAHEPHLAHCELCLAKAERLTSEDDLVAALRDTDRIEETSPLDDGGVVEGLVARISGLNGRPNFGRMLTEDELRSILAPAKTDDELGRLGSYRVLEVLGAGGMGVVFKAEDVELGRTVAIKVMKPQLAASREACRRFRREACAIAAFEHANVVTVYHVGEEQGMPYFSMQLLEGESLRARIDREGQLAPREVLRIGREIAAGLAAAHARGLLHRDIKPDNVWLEGEEGHVRIVDFGLARAVDQSSSLSQSGAILGTPRYMAPEQIRGDDVDERCDLFSLGSLLFHAATGQSAFTGNNLVATLVSVSQDKVARPAKLNPDLPQSLSDLILQLLEKDPANRFQSAAEVVAKIEQIEKELDGIALAEERVPSRATTFSWLAAAGIGLLLAAAAIVYLVTDKGTLVIEADESVAVTIVDGAVAIRDQATGREYKVSVGEKPMKTGVYEIFALDKESGLEFSSREFSILRGKKRAITISLRAEPPAASDAVARAVVKPAATPSWLSETEDTLGIKPGDPLSKLALVTKPAAVRGVASWTVEPTHHRSAVADMEYSPDGLRIATVGVDGTVRIWNATTRALQQVIVCPGAVHRVAWSADGRHLASAQGRTGTGSICVWELSDEGARMITKINRSTKQLAWSSDSSLLAFQDGGVQFWEFASGEILPSMGVTGTISRRPWSANGLTLATTSQDGILLWDAAQKKSLGTIGSEGSRGAMWSRTGAYIATLVLPPPTQLEASRGVRAKARHVEVWDFAKRQRIKRFQVGVARFSGELSWSPDEATVVTQLEDVIALWDVKTGELVTTLLRDEPKAHRKVRKAQIDWAPTGNRVATLIDGQVALWDVDAGESVKLAGTSDHVRFSNDGFDAQRQLLTTSAGYESVRSALWDLRTLNPLLRIEEEGWEMSISPNGRRLATWRPSVLHAYDAPVDLEVRFFDVPEVKRTGEFGFRLSRRPRVEWSPDSKLLAFYCDQYPHLVVSDGKEVVHEFGKLHAEALPSSFRYAAKPIAWSPDSKQLAWSDTTRGVEIKDIETGKYVGELGVVSEFSGSWAGLDLVWSPDGKRVVRLLTAHNSTGKIAIWDVSTASDDTPRKPLVLRPAAESRDLVLSPDGRYMASATSSSVVTVWETDNGAEVAAVRTPVDKITSTAWFDDNRHVGFGGVDGAGIVDIETHEVKYRAHEAEYFVPTSQDGNLLAVGWSNHVAFYDAQLTSAVTLVVPTDRDDKLLAVGADGSYRIPDYGEAPRIIVLRDGFQQTLTPDEFSRQTGWTNTPPTIVPAGAAEQD